VAKASRVLRMQREQEDAFFDTSAVDARTCRRRDSSDRRSKRERAAAEVPEDAHGEYTRGLAEDRRL